MSAPRFLFTCESEVHLTALCLRIASDRFDKDAETARDVAKDVSNIPGARESYLRLARQFDDQSNAARALAVRLEDADEESDDCTRP